MQQYRPTSPGRRRMTRPDFTMITKGKPEKGLLAVLHGTGARSRGKISVRHHGGGVKKKYRIIEFGQRRTGESAKVIAIEYDPNRNARIALIEYKDAQRAYIIAPEGLEAGNEVACGEKLETAIVGNRMQLTHIPVGTPVYNIEFQPGKGGKLARSAGASAKVLAIEGRYATIALPSGETRKLLADCYASIGSVSNPQFRFEIIGKAGRMRLRGVRPHVRGTAMNPVDHPHGGGEGKTSTGLKHPKTPWGKNAFGVRTRNRHKYSSALILGRRTKN
ncbi:MAG: 50S ribosomal protein L2 [Candidatus Spechtbacteria bacterium]|nr:50S ribosomal protein L2 [Candidatus Spechtbacteria bacterium]